MAWGRSPGGRLGHQFGHEAAAALRQVGAAGQRIGRRIAHVDAHVRWIGKAVGQPDHVADARESASSRSASKSKFISAYS